MKKNIFTAVVLIVIVILVSIKKSKGLPITEIVMNKTLNAVDLLENGTNKVLKLIKKVYVPTSLSDLPNIPVIGTAREIEHCTWKNQDDILTVPQIISRYGYPAESHTVQTEDGYLLGVHRIPGNKQGKRGGQSVLLQHGLFGSSYDFMVGGGNQTLAFLLANKGYDVWLGNARGNIYSRAHVSRCTHSYDYWDFSWHEMGTKDLPAVIKRIESVTGTQGKIIYIGHSMGTTMAFVLLSELPEVAEESLKLIITLAPSAFMTHMQSPVRDLAPFANDIKWITKNLGVNDFNPSKEVIKVLSYACLTNYTEEICDNFMMLFVGLDENNFNISLLPRLFSHDPAGVSTNTVLHYAQEINAEGKFQKFDYGREGNIAKYGTPTPPQYNLSNVQTPLYLMAAKGDKMTSIIDVKRLARNTKNVGLYEINNPFGHLDFIIGAEAYNLVYKQILKVLQNYTENEI